MKHFIRILMFLFAPLFLIACRDQTKKLPEVTIADTAAKSKDGVNGFARPVLIDSSQFVIYPIVKEKADIDDSYGSGSNSSRRSTTYWNLIFYNTATKQYHLLDTIKMIINSYDREDDISGDKTAGAAGLADRFIFYEITTTDFNKDGELDTDDPKYLYITDRSGNNFRKITPDSLDIQNWHVVKSTGKVLIDAIKDTNHDKKFDDDDEVIPLVYDLAQGGTAEPIFSTAFKIATKKLFNSKWHERSQK